MTPLFKCVPARYFKTLHEALVLHGVDMAAVMHMAGMDADLFQHKDAALSPHELDAFIRAIRQVSGRTDLGFEMGKLIKMNSHELLGYGLMSCSTPDQFLRMGSKHYHLMNEAFTMRYERRGALGEVTLSPLVAMTPECLRFFLETLAMAHQNQMQLMLGSHSYAYDIYLSMPTPPHVQRYHALAPVRFHFQENTLPGVRVVMGADVLDFALPMGNPDVVKDVDARCSALAQRPPKGESGWLAYVTMVLREAQSEQVNLEDIARRVNVSARTIDRYLKKEGLGFRELSDNVRFERAKSLLSSDGATITQAALQLGFSDAANFSRAFRRVVGITPSEFQRQTVRSTP